MVHDWGPQYIVPGEALKTLSGHVLLRETYEENQLALDLEDLGISGVIQKIATPWYYRKKDADTWIKIGESDDEGDNFSVGWDTWELENGEYEVVGLMNVMVKAEGKPKTVCRYHVREVVIQN